MPESFEYAKNGGRKYLFHNRGDGTLRGRHGGARHRLAGAGRWPRRAADLRGTGYPDLFLANDYGVSELSPTRTASGSREIGKRDRRRLARRRAA